MLEENINKLIKKTPKFESQLSQNLKDVEIAQTNYLENFSDQILKTIYFQSVELFLNNVIKDLEIIQNYYLDKPYEINNTKEEVNLSEIRISINSDASENKPSVIDNFIAFILARFGAPKDGERQPLLPKISKKSSSIENSTKANDRFVE